MNNLQPPTVQGNPLRETASRSVFAVTDDWVSPLGKLQPDLVLAAGQQLNRNDREIVPRCNREVPKFRRLRPEADGPTTRIRIAASSLRT